MYQIALGPRNPNLMVWIVQGYRKTTIRLKQSPQTGPYTHFCSAIMGVKVLYVPNSPGTQGPVTHGMGSTGSWLP